MDKRLIYFIIALLSALLLLNIRTTSKLSNLKRDFNNQLTNIENRLYNMEREIFNSSQSTVEAIKTLLAEENSLIKEKKHTVLNFNKETKSSEVVVEISLKEVQKGTKVYLKEEKSGASNTILMESIGSTSYQIKRFYNIDELVKLSVITENSSIKEEYLFDFSLKKLLEGRIIYNGGGMSISTSPSSENIGYSQDISFKNNCEGDKNLMLSKITAKVEADDQIIFSEEYNREYNSMVDRYAFGKLPYNYYEENGIFAEDFNIKLLSSESSGFSRDFQLRDGTALKITIRVVDNLGLTYEYSEKFIVTLEKGSIREENADKGSHEFKLTN